MKNIITAMFLVVVMITTPVLADPDKSEDSKGERIGWDKFDQTLGTVDITTTGHFESPSSFPWPSRRSPL